MVLKECDIPVTYFTAMRREKRGFWAVKKKSRRLGVAILQFPMEYSLIRLTYIVDP